MTDCAVLQFVIDVGETYQLWRDEHPEESYAKLFEFTSERKSMTTVTKADKGVHKIYSKGAAEIILPNCTSTYSNDGQIKPFSKEDMEKVQNVVIKPMQDESLRILCLASRSVPEDSKYVHKK
jgi:Ca2+ transporting ATPase